MSLGNTLDLGDLTHVPVTRSSIPAGNTTSLDEITFTVDQPERLSISTAAGQKSPDLLRLEDGGGDIAFGANNHSIAGVVAAGTYDLFDTVFAGSADTLIVQARPIATTGQSLFVKTGQPVAGGWTYVDAGPTTAEAAQIKTPAKVAATVNNEDFYSFTTSSYGRSTVTVQSQSGNEYLVKLLDSTGDILNGQGTNPTKTIGAAGTYYVMVQNLSTIGFPVAYHLDVTFSATP